ncbi:adenylyl-sulfate kinase 3-like isoform X2 [Neltuma alba]|uniref:adenylyl-sulfate kinase 3-like isoform X2 n=1 Tax=Neltuma alba TaxID=207710 RepID=UPI0010A4AEEA|nr:adenylyl-sulfate kinase 3-like isoform X2 [Prosopis alba]
MSTILALRPLCYCGLLQINGECRTSVTCPHSTAETLGFMKLFGINVIGLDHSRRSLSMYGNSVRSNIFKPIKAENDSGASLVNDCAEYSGKSTLACVLSQNLHSRGKLAYILDGDNVRHGLNKDLSFRAEDRSENIRRIGEVAKLLADAGVICITSLISPYRKDRDACRALLSKGDFIEVFLDAPLDLCESRDPKGLYKLARAGKIKGFTGIDDPYEPPSSCEIVLQQKGSDCASPGDMAERVIAYLEDNGYLRA